VELSQYGHSSTIIASCNYPSQEGLIVKTDTERVIKTRKIMAELLSARCPDSEEIKRIAEELGVREQRITPKDKDCLLCGLCVRMCSVRMRRGAIGFAGRADGRYNQLLMLHQMRVRFVVHVILYARIKVLILTK
jgi:bidirectional [NiFe] hydrogenase diaphorase subunit